MRLGLSRLFALAFAGFFCVIAAWAFAAPYDATADERDHVYRAVGVVSGEVMPPPEKAVRESGAFQTVPRGLVRDPKDVCLHWMTDKPATCAQQPTADSTPVRAASGAGRYHPAYYALVGGPMKLWPGWPGIYLSRLISAAMCAALLAAAVVCIARYAPYGSVLAGLFVAATPTGMHFFAAVNPNGPEIAAAIAFFAAAIPLATGRWRTVTGSKDAAGTGAAGTGVGSAGAAGDAAAGSNGGVVTATAGAPVDLVTVVGISALWLAMLRPTGLMFLAGAAVALLLPLNRRVLAGLWASRPVRWWLGVLIFAGVTSLAWVKIMDGGDAGTTFRPAVPYSAGQAFYNIVGNWANWIEQAIGLFAWISVRVPQPSYMIWQGAAGLLVLAALAGGRWVDRWRIAVLFCSAVVLPSAVQFYYINSVGGVMQGRYLLPGLTGVVLMAAYVADERALAPRLSRSLVRLFALALMPVHLVALLFLMMRWQKGVPDVHFIGAGNFNPFTGAWHPAVGSATPFVLMLVGLLAVGSLAWFVRPAQAPATAPAKEPATEPAADAPKDSAVEAVPDGALTVQISGTGPQQRDGDPDPEPRTLITRT